MWNITVESFISNSENVLKYVNENWDKIPLIERPLDIVDGNFFKFRGMVQDMLDPVFFYSIYEVLNKKTGNKELRSGMYRDTLECSEDEELLLGSDKCVSGQRKRYFCVTIPALNDWTFLNPNIPRIIEQPGPSQAEKRSAEEMETDDGHETKRYCTESGGRTLYVPEENSHPIASHLNMGCLVQFHDEINVSLKVTDTLEVVGFAYSDSSDDNSVKAPRLHAVAYRQISSSNPLCTPLTNKDQVLQDAKCLRSELHMILTQLFLGDHLVADYFIAYLLARVYKRQDCLVLGKLSLNISYQKDQVGIHYPDKIYKILSKLVPKSHYFPMSIARMNAIVMSPSKNYETNRLNTGLLQLSSQTFFVIDETKLEEGKLEAKGVDNFKALSSLILDQKVNYDFQFYNMDFETDIGVLVLSDGKSILPTDCRLNLKPESNCVASDELVESILKYLSEPLLSKLRLYLTVASMSEFDLPDDLMQSIQDHFVSLRQTAKATPEDMHHLLVLARWVGLSYGEKTLNSDIWSKVCQMDTLRRERLVQ